MKRRNVNLLWAGVATFCFSSATYALNPAVTVLASSNSHLTYRVTTSDEQISQFQSDELTSTDLSTLGYGRYIAPNAPILPSTTWLIEIQPNTLPGIKVKVNSSERIEAKGTASTYNFSTGRIEPYASRASNQIYPEACYSVGQPVSFRGRTLLPVTIYPIQYDSQTDEYITNNDVEVSVDGDLHSDGLRGTLALPSNISKAISVISGTPERDDLAKGTPAGSYLVVAHEDCLPYAIPLLEWKRQSGHSVTVLSYAPGMTAAAVKEDIQSIYDVAVDAGEEPFEYLMIIGDRVQNRAEAPWTFPSFVGNPSMEGAHHADYIYGLLDVPNDPVMDVAVGRITAGSEDRMELAINRQLSYEKSPNMADPEWFTTAGVATQYWDDGGVNMETFYTTRWGEQVLKGKGFQNINRYENTDGDLNGVAITPVMTEWFNAGMNVWIGRARIQGWTDSLAGVESHADGHFPYGITLGSHGEYPAEWIYGEGDGEHLKGAVVWTTVWGQTSTVYNNGVWQSLVSGVYSHDLPIGWARAMIGLQWQVRFPDQDAIVARDNYQTDVDLYGDPGLQPWTAVPTQVDISYDQEISVGTDYLDVTITQHGNANPVAGVTVTLYSPGDIADPAEYQDHEPTLQIAGVTDADGHVGFNIDGGLPAGTFFITATGRNICPVWEEIELQNENLPNLVAENVQVVIGEPRAGSTCAFGFSIRNNGNGIARNVSGVSESLSDYAVMDEIHFNLGDIPAGEAVRYAGNVPVSFLTNTPDGFEPELALVLTSGGNTYRTLVRITASAPLLSASGIDAEYQLGEAIVLNPRVTNNGHANYGGGTARLISDDWRVEVINDEAIYPQIGIGQNSIPINGDRFLLRARPGAIAGANASLRLILNADSTTSVIPITFALANNEAVRGPEPADAYGYTCLDNNDTGWVRFPFNSWYEISPLAEADTSGDTLPLGGSEDTATVIALPFPFKFYGQTFDSITVCDNGFVSVGSQDRMINFENTRMELATGGAVGMIAPFWESLTLQPFHGIPTGVFSCYDESNHRFIIEWYEIHPKGGLETSLNFQLQILDQRHYQTVTGDNPLLFHYKDITNFSVPNDGVPFASVGISSPDGRQGLGVNFNAAGTDYTPLVRPRAQLLFVTTPRTSVDDRAIVRGIVVEPNGQPFVGEPVKITALGLGVLWETVTNENGEFFFGDVLPGTYSLEVHRATFNPIKRSITITDGVELNERVVMTHPTPIFSYPYTDRQIVEFRDSLRSTLPAVTFRRGIYIRNRGNGPLQYFTKVTDDNGMRNDWFRIENASAGVVEPGEVMTMRAVVTTFPFPAGIDTTYHGFLDVIDTISGNSIRLPLSLNVNPNNDVQGGKEDQPFIWSLGDNYPNPFNATTRIGYSVASRTKVKLILFDTNGRLLRTLVEQDAQPGEYTIVFDAADLPPGLYLLRMEAGLFQDTRKIVLVK